METPLRIEERPLTDLEWDSLVDALPGATLFHRSTWLHLIERHFAARWRKMVFSHGDRLVGLLPLLEAKRGPLKLGCSPLSGQATPYLGPLVEAGYAAEAAGCLDQGLRDRGYDYVEMAFWGVAQAEAYRNLGFEVEVHQTRQIDLTLGADTLWQQLRCRSQVRKALRSGISVREVALPAYEQAYRSLALDTYAHQGRLPPVPRLMIVDVWQTLHPSGQARLWVAELEGEPIAGVMMLYHNGQAYYWDAVAKRATLGLRPANLLLWHTIEAAANAGYTTYDLVGANVPSIARFKAGFGGGLDDYLYVHRPYTLLAKAGRLAYQKGAPLVRRTKHLLTSLKPSSGGD